MGIHETLAATIESKSELVAYLASGSKPEADWRIGTEHEKFGFTTADLNPIPYAGPSGVRAMFDGLAGLGWKPIFEGDHPIAMERDGASISLEPGGQFELSGGPLVTLHDNSAEIDTHIREIHQVGDPLGIRFMGIGFHPTKRRDEIPVMPKGRYDIMRRYMPTRGNLGLDMMLRTSTVQVNLDFSSEADMVEKFRVSLALQPVATALFANSPFTEGKPNGFQTYRSHIWTDTDPDRCGILPFVFEPGMSFERYVDYVLDVPMYFVYRNGQYIDASGQSFRDFMVGKLPALPGELPTIKDWQDHLTTLFPEVRLKKFLEMRGADVGPVDYLKALPAFWVGLLYDDAALDAASQLVKDWTVAEHQALRDDVPRLALQTPFRSGTMQDLAKEVLAIADGGLRRRGLLDVEGEDESIYLAPLWDDAITGETPADRLLAGYSGPWGGSVDPVFEELAY
ncbi:glutamate--cysteine ligase [Govanella unica]|uniref:Glutamate--cysteine ligase n=1 Tax=Govanella unica TaxID=2975056 RepID=A0A9X3TX79_9PROT|nr:glutamate--cysteine ligase [Govania unica]MDA5193345.1 glutamate--cysteine ligase [Govania unica]